LRRLAEKKQYYTIIFFYYNPIKEFFKVCFDIAENGRRISERAVERSEEND
jgi:hypothetical protein